MDVFAKTFAPAASRGYLATLADLTAHGVPVALYFRDIGIPGDVKVPRAWIAYPWLAIYAASFAAVALRLLGRTRTQLASPAGTALSRVRNAVAACPELPVVALFPVFLLVLAATNQEFNDYGTVRWITFRILAPVVPAMLMTIALAVSRAGAALRVPVLVACVAAGLAGTGQLLVDGSAQRANVEAEARLTGAEAMGHLIVFKHGTEPVAAAVIDAMPVELRERAWRGVGFSFAYLYGTSRASAPVSHLVAALVAIEPEHRAAAIEGARLAVGAGLPQVPALLPSPRRDEVAAAIDVAAQAPVAVPDASDRAASGRG
jgi:hypothetical protein